MVLLLALCNSYGLGFIGCMLSSVQEFKVWGTNV